jgi:hypothetical protein
MARRREEDSPKNRQDKEIGIRISNELKRSNKNNSKEIIRRNSKKLKTQNFRAQLWLQREYPSINNTSMSNGIKRKNGEPKSMSKSLHQRPSHSRESINKTWNEIIKLYLKALFQSN